MLWLFGFISPSIPLSVLSLSHFFFSPTRLSFSRAQIERHGQFLKFLALDVRFRSCSNREGEPFFPPVMGACCSGSRTLSANDIGSPRLVTSCAPDMKLPRV